MKVKISRHSVTRSTLILSVSWMVWSCASAPKVSDHSEFTVSKKPDLTPIAVLPTTAATGIVPYKFEQKSANSQWMKCTIPKSQGSVLIMHRFDSGFDPQLFCKGWVAQSFIKKGFNVVAVNRPGYAGSNGVEDLAGPQSMAAIKAGLDASGLGSQVKGIWGYDVGTIAAAFFAKQNPNIQWLILGGGIYDLEITARSTESAGLKSSIQKIKSTEGDLAFERRSIAWDFNGLPKTVALYYSKNDKVAPTGQADAFNAQLRTAEYKVFNNEIAGGSHELPWRDHMTILEAAIDQVAPIKK